MSVANQAHDLGDILNLIEEHGLAINKGGRPIAHPWLSPKVQEVLDDMEKDFIALDSGNPVQSALCGPRPSHLTMAKLLRAKIPFIFDGRVARITARAISKTPPPRPQKSVEPVKPVKPPTLKNLSPTLQTLFRSTSKANQLLTPIWVSEQAFKMENLSSKLVTMANYMSHTESRVHVLPSVKRAVALFQRESDRLDNLLNQFQTETYYLLPLED